MIPIMIKRNTARSKSAGKPLYTIREGASRSSTCCACGREVTGGGPVGYRGEQPVCDRCLLDGSAQLGMVIALISVTRGFAAICARAPKEWLEPFKELGAFARIYECFAAKSGPMRRFHLPDAPAKDAAARGEKSG